MCKTTEQRLSAFINSHSSHLLKESLMGLEKESLRVNKRGHIAQTPHPVGLGSALTHPYITTDFSEALCEFITPPLNRIENALKFLCNTQKFVYHQLDNEILWATSMPCVVEGETNIPIAYYGPSNAGTMKTVYRRGLGHRYGRVMQVIAGVHFNYSFSENFWQQYQNIVQSSQDLQTFKSSHYFSLIRNIRRYGWLIPYLFGASPAVCKSFLGHKKTTLQAFDEFTYYEPFATSLRMGDIGYQNSKEHETGVNPSYNSLAEYIHFLQQAIETPCTEHEKIGLKKNGEYRQLNANRLQIENEYYSTTRPKQLLNNNEKPILALQRRGVRYVELRSLDVNAFDPLGINVDQLHFLETFFAFCLFHPSPPIDPQETKEIDANYQIVAHQGRKPGIQLQRHGQSMPLVQWASELCEQLTGFAELLDTNENTPRYQATLVLQQDLVKNPDHTPSARLLAEMRANKESFYHFAMRKSVEHRNYFERQTLTEQQKISFIDEINRSLAKQKSIEATDTLTFEAYLQHYFSQQ